MRLRPIHFVLLLPVCTALVVFAGCDDGATTSRGKKRPISGGDEAEVARKEYEPKGYGTITGKVTYNGTPPTLAPISMGPQCCQASGESDSENFEQDWLVDKNGGVKNVVIILQPPSGKYFKLPTDQQTPKEMQVTLHQPRCQFIPHVFVTFPSFWDGVTNSEKPTGQKLQILNDAGCPHNFNFIVIGDRNRSGGALLAPTISEYRTLYPQAEPLVVSCNIHGWMRAYGFACEHPYFAITKSDGTFVIENAPLGVPVQVVAWHEATTPNFFNGGLEGKSETLQDKQELNFKIKKGR
jgi:hypothetical protein